MVVAVGVELLWNGGSAVGVSSSEFTRGGSDVLRVRGREQARGRVDCDAGSPGVLRRVQDGSPRHCREPSTAALWWQPRGRFWAAWQSGVAPAQGKGGRWRCSATRGSYQASRRWRVEAALHGGRAAHGTGGGKQRSRQEEEEKDWFANSENFRDPDVNQR